MRLIHHVYKNLILKGVHKNAITMKIYMSTVIKVFLSSTLEHTITIIRFCLNILKLTVDYTSP